jgi:putative ABC transport system substrate-binding protein
MQFGQLKRRDFMTLLGGAAVGLPLAARAQQGDGRRRIGVLMGLAETDPEGQSRVAAFRRTLHALGWTEDRNLHVDYRWAAGDVARTQAFATELVSLNPEVIVVNTPPGLNALRQATSSIPIVFAQAVDVSESGITNPACPETNITGFTGFYTYEMSGKWLGLLREIAPLVARVAVLQNPKHPSWAGYRAAIEAVASAVGLQIKPALVNVPEDIDRALDAIAQESNAGLVVLPDTFTVVHRGRIVRLANQHGLPAIYPVRFFATAGGLMSYGSDIVELVRLTATYVDRILRGATPNELPVQSSTKFDLVINLKTAKALGLHVAPTLLARADEVIE